MTTNSEKLKTGAKELYKEPDGKLEGSDIEKIASLFEILRSIDQRQKRNGKNN